MKKASKSLCEMMENGRTYGSLFTELSKRNPSMTKEQRHFVVTEAFDLYKSKHGQKSLDNYLEFNGE